MRARSLSVPTLDLARAAAEGLPVMPEVLEVLDRYVGADTLSVSAMQLGDQAETRAEVSLRGAAPMRPDELALWPALMATHPYLPHLVAGPMTTSRVTDVVDMLSFERTPIYEQLLGPRGSRYQAALLLERTPNSMFLLALWRKDHDFTDEEVERLEAFRAVMAAALAFARAVEAVEATGSACAGTGDARAEAAGLGADRALLTRRQRQVAVLIEAGLTNDQIARRLGISSRTVRKHIEDLFEHTGARSRTQVAVWWRQGGGTATGRCGRCSAPL